LEGYFNLKAAYGGDLATCPLFSNVGIFAISQLAMTGPQRISRAKHPRIKQMRFTTLPERSVFAREERESQGYGA
jgi:hypothetical protein